MARTEADQQLINTYHAEVQRLKDERSVITRSYEAHISSLRERLNEAHEQLDDLWDRFTKLVQENEYLHGIISDIEDEQDERNTWVVGEPFTIGVDWRP